MSEYFYLASTSPRRRELLQQLDARFITLAVEVDESWLTNEAPADYVQRVALAKARAGQAVAPGQAPVLGADTAVVVDGNVLGKPVDDADARAMLASLSGRWHEVMTAVACVAGEANRLAVSTSRVSMRPLSPADCAAYVATGESAGKAGAYAIQGIAGAFVERLEGSYSGVMGLPLHETTQLLAGVGWQLLPSGLLDK